MSIELKYIQKLKIISNLPLETKSIFNISLSKSLTGFKIKGHQDISNNMVESIRYAHQYPGNLQYCFIFQIIHLLREIENCKP